MRDSDDYRELLERLGQVNDLSRAAALLAWDERTMMPPAGGEARAEQLATLAGLRHEMFCDQRIGELIEDLRGAAEELPADSDESALVRIVDRDWRKATLVPAELRADIERSSSLAEQAWVEAREASDYARLLPHLERNLELLRRYIDCYDGFEDFSHPYDPLLDEYEPGMRTAEASRVLGELRDGLVPLVEEVLGKPGGEAAEAGAPSPGSAADSPFRGDFPIEAQRELLIGLVDELPLVEGSWRLDPTTHPFAIGIAEGDVRITTRYDESDLSVALFSVLHEAGHALYESGVDPALARTPLAKPRSLGLHESQSRLWENWVGRGRPYLEHLVPMLEAAFDGAVVDADADADAESLYRAANVAERSLIRVEADELTYNLHILIRFELEVELVEGKLALADLPEAWNARYRDYLGLEVPDDARGVLQDVHWAGGAIGYFPTYSLGNLIAAELWQAALGDISGLEDSIRRGDLAPLGDWLRDRVHRHGRKLSPAEILERAGCGPISVEPLLEHLRSKFTG